MVCESVQLVRWYCTNVSKEPATLSLAMEDKGGVLLQDVISDVPNNTAPHPNPRRPSYRNSEIPSYGNPSRITQNTLKSQRGNSVIARTRLWGDPTRNIGSI